MNKKADRLAARIFGAVVGGAVVGFVFWFFIGMYLNPSGLIDGTFLPCIIGGMLVVGIPYYIISGSKEDGARKLLLASPEMRRLLEQAEYADKTAARGVLVLLKKESELATPSSYSCTIVSDFLFFDTELTTALTLAREAVKQFEQMRGESRRRALAASDDRAAYTRTLDADQESIREFVATENAAYVKKLFPGTGPDGAAQGFADPIQDAEISEENRVQFTFHHFLRYNAPKLIGEPLGDLFIELAESEIKARCRKLHVI